MTLEPPPPEAIFRTISRTPFPPEKAVLIGGAEAYNDARLSNGAWHVLFLMAKFQEILVKCKTLDCFSEVSLGKDKDKSGPFHEDDFAFD